MVKIVDGQIVKDEEAAGSGTTAASAASALPSSLSQPVRLFGQNVPAWGLGAGALLVFFLFGPSGVMLMAVLAAVGYFCQAPSGSGGGAGGRASSQQQRRKGPTIRGVKDLPQAPRG